MNKFIEISPQENEIIDPYLKSMSDIAKHQITLEKLINNWDKFVKEVINGYQLSIYDYENDLSTRDLLEKIINKSPISLKIKIINVIEESDNIFKQSTKSIEIPLKPLFSNDFWWWFRVPINLCEELKSDLLSEGLLSKNLEENDK